MVETLASSPSAVVSGIGPGNGKESTDRSEQLVMNPLVKAIVEYGLFVGILWMVFIHGCVLRTAAPGIVAVAVLIQYDFLNGSLLVPIHLVYCYILAGAYPRVPAADVPWISRTPEGDVPKHPLDSPSLSNSLRSPRSGWRAPRN
jgi:hypothetical protein